MDRISAEPCEGSGVCRGGGLRASLASDFNQFTLANSAETISRHLRQYAAHHTRRIHRVCR